MIVGLVGGAGTGKSTIANYLVSAQSYREDSFAKTLKDAVSAVFSWDRAMLEGATPESRAWREQTDAWWAARLNIPHFSPRFALQHIGTELFRNSLSEDVWIASFQRRLQASPGARIVVSDVRFANEAAAIRDAGGILIKVIRPGTVSGNHATETQWTEIQTDHVIINDGTLSDLIDKIDTMIL